MSWFVFVVLIAFGVGVTVFVWIQFAVLSEDRKWRAAASLLYALGILAFVTTGLILGMLDIQDNPPPLWFYVPGLACWAFALVATALAWSDKAYTSHIHRTRLSAVASEKWAGIRGRPRAN